MRYQPPSCFGTIHIGDVRNVEMGLVGKGPVLRSNLTSFCNFSLVINLFSTADFKFFVVIEIRGPLYSRRKPFLKPSESFILSSVIG